MKRATRRFQTAITAGVIAGTLLLPVSAYAENGSAAETDVTAATAETVPPPKHQFLIGNLLASSSPPRT